MENLVTLYSTVGTTCIKLNFVSSLYRVLFSVPTEAIVEMVNCHVITAYSR